MTLVVTRKPDQQIKIGDDVLITIVAITYRGEVRVGIDAPRHITIERIDRPRDAA